MNNNTAVAYINNVGGEGGGGLGWCILYIIKLVANL